MFEHKEYCPLNWKILSFVIHSINIYWVPILCKALFWALGFLQKTTGLPSWNSHFGGGNRPGQSLVFSVDFREYSGNSSQEATDFMENIWLQDWAEIPFTKPDSEVLKLEAHINFLTRPRASPHSLISWLDSYLVIYRSKSVYSLPSPEFLGLQLHGTPSIAMVFQPFDLCLTIEIHFTLWYNDHYIHGWRDR